MQCNMNFRGARPGLAGVSRSRPILALEDAATVPGFSMADPLRSMSDASAASPRVLSPERLMSDVSEHASASAGSAILPEEDPDSIEEMVREATELRTVAKEKAKGTRKGRRTRKAKAKAKPKAKAKAKSTARPRSAAASPLVIGGCSKCRGSAGGCPQCRDPSFRGRRFLRSS